MVINKQGRWTIGIALLIAAMSGLLSFIGSVAANIYYNYQSNNPYSAYVHVAVIAAFILMVGYLIYYGKKLIE